jgi:hypothetical protein
MQLYPFWPKQIAADIITDIERYRSITGNERKWGLGFLQQRKNYFQHLRQYVLSDLVVKKSDF